MKWTHYTENEIKNEHSISDAGCVINFPLQGWEAWVTLPGQPDHKVGECYKTEASGHLEEDYGEIEFWMNAMAGRGEIVRCGDGLFKSASAA